MFVYRYDYLSANECGITEHAITQMENLGCKIVAAEPVPIADCWMISVEKELESLPPYLKKVDFVFTSRR